MSVTEVEHLRAEVARLEAELSATRTPPSMASSVEVGVARVDRSIEILTAILDGPQVLMGGRLNEISLDPSDPAEAGMFYMGQLAASLLHAVADHVSADHAVTCGSVRPIELVRAYARATVGVRDGLRSFADGRKAGG